MKISDKIRTERTRRGWTQGELADRCGWPHQSRVGNYESGSREPKFKDLEDLARAFGMHLVVEFAEKKAPALSVVGEPGGNYSTAPRAPDLTATQADLLARLESRFLSGDLNDYDANQLIGYIGSILAQKK